MKFTSSCGFILGTEVVTNACQSLYMKGGSETERIRETETKKNKERNRNDRIMIVGEKQGGGACKREPESE